MENSELHLLLKKYLARKKKSSPGFSLRALAQRLGVSAPFLSRVMNGKKPIPADLLPQLARALDVEPELLAPKKKSKTTNAAVAEWALADMQATQILRNWYYIPILELTTLVDFDGKAETVARRLNLSTKTTEVALRELVGLGLLRLEDGRYAKSEQKLRITSSKSLPLIRKFHDEMLEQSQQHLRTALGEEDFQRRLITGITVSASPEKVQEAKQRLADFLHELANDLAADPGTDVYHLSAQLFPITKS
jgi:uncharacterized protein (TIGR02147 family)